MNFVSPNRITFDELPKFLALRAGVATLQNCEIYCNCQSLIHVDPMGLCLLKHWFVELQERGVMVHLQNLRYNIELYLARMDLFKGIDSVKFEDRTSTQKRRDLRGSIVEIQSLYNLSEIGPVATQIAQALVPQMPGISSADDPEQMHASPAEKLEQDLEYIFSEILLNALDHGRRRNYKYAHANIAALYYQQLDKLEIAILDNGCGLFETLQTHPAMEGELSDNKAISIALRPKVSCNRDVDIGLDTKNQGIGLTVSTQMALQAGGRCGIFSGNASQSLLLDYTEALEISYWQGTGVFFQFSKNQITKIDKSKIMQALPGYRTIQSINFG